MVTYTLCRTILKIVSKKMNPLAIDFTGVIMSLLLLTICNIMLPKHILKKAICMNKISISNSSNILG